MIVEEWAPSNNYKLENIEFNLLSCEVKVARDGSGGLEYYASFPGRDNHGTTQALFYVPALDRTILRCTVSDQEFDAEWCLPCMQS